MLKKNIIGTVALLLLLLVQAEISPAEQYKLSVFNFVAANLESSGLGTAVTNSLINSLKNNPSFSLLDRKDLEAFLSLNDLQQNDQLDNVIHIGSRLGLDFIIVGAVNKRGSLINVSSSLIHIEKKKEVYHTRARAIGESALTAEITKIASLISEVISKDNSAGSAGSQTSTASPVNFQKISGNKRITLRWQDAPGFAAAGYEVYRALSQNGPFAMLGQTDKTSYIDQNVENNTVYFYKIRAIDKLSRLSEFTPVISASTDIAPNPPIIMKTEGRAKSILIVWDNSPIKSQDTSKLIGYKIYRAKAEEENSYHEVAKLSVADLSGSADGKMYYRDKALPDGKTFLYRIAAFNEKNIESELSHPLKGTTLSIVPSVSVKSELIREVKLSWSIVQSPFIVAYNIYRSGKADGKYAKIKKISATDVKADFVYSDLDGLNDKTNYYYYVTAEDDLGVETAPSPVAQAVTRGIPPQPENFAARSGMVKKVELTWQAAKQEEVEGYNIYWSLEKESQYTLLKKISGRENNNYIDESRGFDKLADGKTYYYLLRAYNKVPVESLSAVANATTKHRPQKPSGLKGQSLKVKEVPLSWLANPEKDVNIYYIYRAFGNKDDFSNVGEVNKNDYTDKNLKDGATYLYKIQAKDKDGLLSDYSDVISVGTKPKPQPPAGLNGKYENSKAEISWSPNKEVDISHYIIYEKVFLGAEKIAEVKSTNYSDASLVKGKSKTYMISAVDKEGLESERSMEVTVSAK